MPVSRNVTVLFLVTLLLGACDSASTTQQAAEAAPATISTTTAQLDARTMQLWSSSCALCHVDGNAGAPRLGYKDEWSPRLTQGEAALLQHTVEGLNSMPPLGYCMACEREHFVAMIRFMTAQMTQPEDAR